MKRSHVAVLCGSLVAFASIAPAQVPLTPRAVGTAGAYVGLARGHEALFLNPANLALPDGPRWSVALPQIATGVSVIGPEANTLWDYFNSDELDEGRRQELLNEIPASGAELGVDVRAPLAVIQRGPFAVGVSYGVLAGHTVGRDLVELFFEGYDPARFDYSLGNTAGNRTTFWDVAAGYGQAFGPLSVGVTGHYYRLGSRSATRAFGPDYDIPARDITVEYLGVSSEGGSGYGLDVGAAFQPSPGFTLSAAVSNAISTITWNDELVGRGIVLTRADFEDPELGTVRSRYERSGEPLGSSPTGRYATLATGLLDDATMPSTLRVGAGLALPVTGTSFTAAYQSNLRDGDLGGSWTRLGGVGIQQRIPLITLRAGISSDFDSGSILAGGLTLGPIDVGLARVTQPTESADHDRRGWVASFGLSARGR